jgi:hypothetical protein
MRHTQGPWRHDAPTSFVVDGLNRIIADIGGRCDEIAKDGTANARLIAMAPELFDALELAQRALENVTNENFKTQALAFIYKVLAKAQGDVE